MSLGFEVVNCNLCPRSFKKYNKKEASQIHGVELVRSKTYSVKLEFVGIDKTQTNKHICTYCISDILNKFQD